MRYFRSPKMIFGQIFGYRETKYTFLNAHDRIFIDNSMRRHNNHSKS